MSQPAHPKMRATEINATLGANQTVLIDFSLYDVNCGDFRRKSSGCEAAYSQRECAFAHQSLLRTDISAFLKMLKNLFSLDISASRRTALIAFASKSNCRSALHGTVVRRILLRKIRRWWVEEDLNLRPHAYQACALTT